MITNKLSDCFKRYQSLPLPARRTLISAVCVLPESSDQQSNCSWPYHSSPKCSFDSVHQLLWRPTISQPTHPSPPCLSLVTSSRDTLLHCAASSTAEQHEHHKLAMSAVQHAAWQQLTLLPTKKAAPAGWPAAAVETTSRWGRSIPTGRDFCGCKAG